MVEFMIKKQKTNNRKPTTDNKKPTTENRCHKIANL
jgi:hypothetical protein